MTAAARPLVASLGDPAGIGPEMFLRAWLARQEAGLSPFAVVGSASLMAQVAQSIPGARIETSSSLEDAEFTFDSALPVLDHGPLEYRPGHPDADGARLALAALKTASDLALSGTAAALVTGPIAKAGLQDIGWAYPGQTEFVADTCGVAASDAVMMLAGPSLRVVPMTVHCPLSAVPALLSEDLIYRRIAIAAQALARDHGLERPRIAVAGLNPHAGEQGHMGDEEIKIITPALERLRADGFDITGPLPADAMFHAAARTQYDLAVCMYHDQALIPLKALHFDEGVNVTLGLPVIRTSPDHGTAFALAGTGRASPGPTIAAIRMAGECAARRAAG